MKIIAIIFLISITCSICFAELQIPETIKENSRQMKLNDKLDEKEVMFLLSLLVDQRIIQNTHTLQQIYTIPEEGKTEFIKISGRINELRRTAQVNLEIIKPDGTFDKITSPLIETGSYSTVYAIDSKSQIGTYKVISYFSGEKKSVSYFHLSKTKVEHQSFPLWLVTTFQWWSEDKISDLDLINSVQHLANLGLIQIPEKSPSLYVNVTGEKLVRRGTTHTINVHVTDGIYPINGAKVTLTIEDYGENIIREFDGFTDQTGFFVYSWEIPKTYSDYETLLAFISVSGNGLSQTKIFKFQVYCLPGTSNCDIEGN